MIAWFLKIPLQLIIFTMEVKIGWEVQVDVKVEKLN